MVISDKIKLSSRGENDIIDITEQLRKAVMNTSLINGIVTVFIPGSTGGISTIEYEPGVVSDVKAAFEKIAPRKAEYAHNTKLGDGNGFAHVRASLIGPSLTIPIIDGKVSLGVWQQVVFIDFDNRHRQREIILQIMGEK